MTLPRGRGGSGSLSSFSLVVESHSRQLSGLISSPGDAGESSPRCGRTRSEVDQGDANAPNIPERKSFTRRVSAMHVVDLLGRAQLKAVMCSSRPSDRAACRLSGRLDDRARQGLALRQARGLASEPGRDVTAHHLQRMISTSRISCSRRFRRLMKWFWSDGAQPVMMCSLIRLLMTPLPSRTAFLVASKAVVSSLKY